MSTGESLFEDVIANATAAMRPPAGYELSDIDVEEVSYVDRAANGRRFIFVKNESGDSSMGTKNTNKNEDGVILTSALKGAAATSLTEVLGHLLAVSNIVKGATEDDDKGSAKLPAEILNGLKVVSKGLSKILLEHTVAKGASQLAEVLVTVSEGSLQLAEQVAVSGEVEAEAIEKMVKLSELLNTATATAKGEKVPTEEEKAAAEATEKAAKDKAKDDKAKEDAKAAKEKEDKKPAFLKGEDGEVDPMIAALVAGQEKTSAQIADLTAAIAAGHQASAVTETAEEKMAKQLDEVKKSLADRDTELEVVAAKLAKASEAAPEGRSSSEGGDDGRSDVTKNDEGQVLFPTVYGSDIHDPAPEA